jgi:hypothetical protein
LKSLHVFVRKDELLSPHQADGTSAPSNNFVLPHYASLAFGCTSSHRGVTAGHYYRSLTGSGGGRLKLTQEPVVIGPTVTVVIQNMGNRDCVRRNTSKENDAQVIRGTERCRRRSMYVCM